MRNRTLKPRILSEPADQSVENKQVGAIEATKDGKSVIEGPEQTRGRNELGNHPGIRVEVVKDDLGMDLVKVTKGFGGVNKGYEMRFRGGSTPMSPCDGGRCFAGSEGWIEDGVQSVGYL